MTSPTTVAARGPALRGTAIRERWRRRLPHRRTVLKVVHWTMVPLLLWFLFMTPSVVLGLGGQEFFRIHSNIALFFVTITLLWFADYLRRGLASRPGPKLHGWGRRMHWWLHRLLIWGLFGVALTGFLLGLTSAVLLKAGGWLPIAPPLDMEHANEIVGRIHIFEFYILAGIVVVHAGFHIWRHVRLRDNALRIMFPRALHRYL